MTTARVPAEKSEGGSVPWWWLGLALMIPIVAISGQSFWIDEACTCWKAQQPTLSGWWTEMVAERGSDLQMPLYQLFIWGWTKVFGTSEIALRAANLPWFWLGLFSLSRGLARVPQVLVGWILGLLVSPLVWYYLDEARPYAMQIGLSLVVLAALWRMSGESDPGRCRGWCWALCGGVWALCGSSMLAMIFCAAFLGASLLATGWARLRLVIRMNRGCLLVMLAGCTAWGAYYLWTLKAGAGGVRAPADFRNVLFVVYEILGFSGLGPGRTEMRSGAVSVIRPYLGWLVTYAPLVGGAFLVGFARLRQEIPSRVWNCFLLTTGLAVAFLFGVGFTIKFRVLGRHFIPVLPLVCLCLGRGAMVLVERGRIWRWAGAAFVAMSLLSALELRWADRHAKDAYREAAAWTRAALARGESVWWNADPRGAQVYHVPIQPGSSGRASVRVVANPVAGFNAGLADPDAVVASKPDIYDFHGVVGKFLTESGYQPILRLPGFTIWRRDVSTGHPRP